MPSKFLATKVHKYCTGCLDLVADTPSLGVAILGTAGGEGVRAGLRHGLREGL